MRDRKPSPAKATKERITRNLRRYEILTERIKRFISMDSPEYPREIKDSVRRIDDDLAESDGKWLDRLKEVSEKPMKKKEDSDDKLRDYIEKGFTNLYADLIAAIGAVDEALELPVMSAYEALADYWKRLQEGLNKGLELAQEKGLVLFDNWDTPIKDALSDIKRGVGSIDIRMPSIDFSAFEPLAELPAILTTLITTITNLFTFDIDEFNETMAKIESIKPRLKGGE